MGADELDRLLREHYSMVRAVCWRILENDSDADDATQNALISIARGYRTFDGRSAVTTWIYRIATNAALDELRRRRRRRFIPLVGGSDREIDVADTRSQQAAESIEARDSLDAALGLVPEEFRIPLVLRDVADLEYEEIARILDIPPGTVRSRISRGRARLAAEWARSNGNPDSVGERPTQEDPSDRQ